MGCTTSKANFAKYNVRHTEVIKKDDNLSTAAVADDEIMLPRMDAAADTASKAGPDTHGGDSKDENFIASQTKVTEVVIQDHTEKMEQAALTEMGTFYEEIEIDQSILAPIEPIKFTDNKSDLSAAILRGFKTSELSENDENGLEMTKEIDVNSISTIPKMGQISESQVSLISSVQSSGTKSSDSDENEIAENGPKNLVIDSLNISRKSSSGVINPPTIAGYIRNITRSLSITEG
jgi:hypothetical protein